MSGSPGSPVLGFLQPDIGEAQDAFGFREFPKDRLRIDSLHLRAANAQHMGAVSNSTAGRDFDLNLTATGQILADKLHSRAHERLLYWGISLGPGLWGGSH
jgi:hypothetical protein